MDLEPLEPVLAEVFEQLVNLLTNGTNFVKQNALEAMALLAAFMDNAFTVVRLSPFPSPSFPRR